MAGILVNNSPLERVDLGVGPCRIVARGLLDMAGAAWVGAHPGFADAITDTGVGDQTVHLAADGAATSFGRCISFDAGRSHRAAPLGGVGLRDLQILCTTYEGADSNPGGGIAGWDAGANAVLGAPIPADGAVYIEVIDSLV